MFGSRIYSRVKNFESTHAPSAELIGALQNIDASITDSIQIEVKYTDPSSPNP